MDLRFYETNSNICNYYFFETGVKLDDISQWRDSLSKENLTDGVVGESVKDETIRKSLTFFLDQSSYPTVYEQIHNMVGTANQSCFKFKLSAMSERIQYSEYRSEDSGFYNWHMDVSPSKSRRKLSLVVQLSDESEYDGGELQIQTSQTVPVIMSKTQGSVIVFPSYLLHRVTPVTRGIRRSLVVWIDGPPFR